MLKTQPVGCRGACFGWPLVIGGVIKGVYDLLLLIKFQKVRPPEEAAVLPAQ
jgi:hypothetical protein